MQQQVWRACAIVPAKVRQVEPPQCCHAGPRRRAGGNLKSGSSATVSWFVDLFCWMFRSNCFVHIALSPAALVAAMAAQRRQRGGAFEHHAKARCRSSTLSTLCRYLFARQTAVTASSSATTLPRFPS